MATIHLIVTLYSVFVMVVIQSTESKPQLTEPLPPGNDDFLALFEVPTTTTSKISLDDEAFLKQFDVTATTTSNISADDAAFLDQFNPKSECKCIPIQSCCDARPGDSPTSSSGGDINGAPVLQGVDGVGVRTFGNNEQNIVIDLADRSFSNSQCDDILSVCCEKECQQTTKTVEESSPAPNRRQCGIKNTNGFRITVTGFEDGQAQLSEFPWMVAVLGQDNTYVGGGSLIHAGIVLTAAHKVHGYSGSIVARIGDWDLSATSEPIPSQAINVTKVLYHPDFIRGTLVNDVALLILEENAVLGDTVMPICLPEIDQVFDKSTCFVSGWGKDVFGATGDYSKIMKKVSVPAVGHSECQNMLRNTRLGPNFNLHDTFNCAGGAGEDACEGDGGSPLVCPNPDDPEQYVQMGVVAWGIGCGIVGNPGVYGSVPKTVKWIRDTMMQEVGFTIRTLAKDGRGKK